MTTTTTTRYGTAAAQAWDRLHPRLTHRSAWLDHDGPLPVIEGTLIRLQVDHLPGDRQPQARLAVVPDPQARSVRAFGRSSVSDATVMR